MFSLQQKIAVVTGGGSGIGRAIAETFAKAGALVHIIELNKEAAAEVVAEITKEGGQATAHSCDVSVQKNVADLVAQIGDIDILVNNAGIAHIGNAESTTEDDFDRIYRVNVKGVFNCMQAVIPVMKSRKRGVILNMSSIAAQLGLSDRFAYSMSKGAVYAMSLSVAKDYLKEGIRCNTISPARVHTPFVDGFIQKNYAGREEEIFQKLSQSQPIGRMGKPAEVAALALYLCSDEAAFITGSDYPIDGGFITLNT
ncbi:MAG TPA: SDR family oxidoreductase [Flavisolibacter sp.]|jgi:NAD(P)-dependent dehydrogenase (short-subunit alcohol dehydrogenase family)|nr:SDR family oxidoreductase [Flavisolibacter sp.]